MKIQTQYLSAAVKPTVSRFTFTAADDLHMVLMCERVFFGEEQKGPFLFFMPLLESLGCSRGDQSWKERLHTDGTQPVPESSRKLTDRPPLLLSAAEASGRRADPARPPSALCRMKQRAGIMWKCSVIQVWMRPESESDS